MRVDPVRTHELQQRIACSDQAAFEELFRLYYNSLFHFSLKYIHVREAAEEITNDVFISLWNRRNEILAVQNLSTYLFIAIKNHSLNYLKKFSNYHITVNEEDGKAEMVSRHDPEKELEWKEISFQLNKAIDQLPDQCRTVFRLIKEEGFKYKEVAEILGISPRTVETQLFRAIKKLNALVQKYVHDTSSSMGNQLPVILLLMLLAIQ